MEHAKRASLLHFLKRRELWISLWLVRLLGMIQSVCGLNKPVEKGGFVDLVLTALARAFMNIVLCHASMRVNVRKIKGASRRAKSAKAQLYAEAHRKVCARRYKSPQHEYIISMRAVIGSALRRAFKAKTLAQRLAKFRHALDNRERLIARLVRRLRRGMTRRGFAHSRVIVGRVDAARPLAALALGLAALGSALAGDAPLPDTS